MRIPNRSRSVSLRTVGRVAIELAAIFGLFSAAPVDAQLLRPGDGQRPSFEVATIRPSRAEGEQFNFQITTSRFKVEGAPLRALIRFAYDIKSDDQLPKGPSWIADEKFDIDAKVEDAEAAAMDRLAPDRKFEQYRLMVQSLLEDRFKLRVSTAVKELPVYALTVAKGGEKLTAASGSPDAMMKRMPTLSGGSRGELKAGAVSMALFARWLSGTADTGGRVVIDSTGLKGSYDFTLNWTPEQLRTGQSSGEHGVGNGALADSSGLSLFTALEEQLGLKLVARRAQVEVLAINHVEEPSPN